MAEVKRLRCDIEKKLNSWNERGNFTLRGVKNLSRSDLDVLNVCCDFYETYGNLKMRAYFSQEVYAVLKKYGLKE